MTEPLSVAFITSTRDDLVGVSRTLAQHIKPEALNDADNPILWSNWGSYNGGKSLIAEESASFLTGETIKGYFESEAFMFGFDSEFHSFFDNQDRQFQFADIYFPLANGKLFGTREKLQRDLLPSIIDGQRKGGVIYVHNANEPALDFGADIEICLKSKRRMRDWFNNNARKMPVFGKRSLTQAGLQRDFDFAKKQGRRPWIKLVELTIHNPDIFTSEFIHTLRFTEELRCKMRESKGESTNLSIIPA